jgi:hypothetical protein
MWDLKPSWHLKLIKSSQHIGHFSCLKMTDFSGIISVPISLKNLSVQGRMLLTELETSARTENKRMTNHNTPELSRMDLPIHCAAFPELSHLNIITVLLLVCETMFFSILMKHISVNAVYFYYRLRDGKVHCLWSYCGAPCYHNFLVRLSV